MTDRPLRAPRTETLFSAAFVLLSIYLLWLTYTAWDRKALWSEDWYAANVGAVAAFAVLALVVGFQRWRRLARGSGILMVLALFGLAWAGTDAYVLVARYDTSGPGGALNFTNARWWKRYVQFNEEGFWERSLTPYRLLKP